MTAATISIDLRLLPHQAQAFDCGVRNVVFAKGRRAGGTEGMCRKALAEAISIPNHKGLWVDTVHRNISRYIKRYFLPKLNHLVDPRTTKPLWSFNGADMTMMFWNGSHIDFASAERPENMQGFAYDHIYLNEAGLILWDEHLYYETILPMGVEGAGAGFYFAGTPKGINLFHKMYNRGQGDDPEWKSFTATSFDNPLVNRPLIERYMRDFPEHMLRQEFFAEFITDGAYFQGLARAAIAEHQPVAALVTRYVIGLDLALADDFTVAWVARADLREAVHMERYGRLPWPDQLHRIADLARRYNNAHVLVDATGLGGMIGLADIAKAGVQVSGFTFTATSKVQILSALAVDIEQGRLRFYPEETTLQELRAFQVSRTSTGHGKLEAPTGQHDDCVIALALANWAMGRPLAAGPVFETTPGIGAQHEGLIA